MKTPSESCLAKELQRQRVSRRLSASSASSSFNSLSREWMEGERSVCDSVFERDSSIEDVDQERMRIG